MIRNLPDQKQFKSNTSLLSRLDTPFDKKNIQQFNLPGKELRGAVLQFAKKSPNQRLHKKHQHYVSSSFKSDEDSKQSLSKWQLKYSLQSSKDNNKILPNKFEGSPQPLSHLLEAIYSNDIQLNIKGPVKQQRNKTYEGDHEDCYARTEKTLTSNKLETRESSSYYPRKSQQILIQPDKNQQKFCYQSYLQVKSIDESFEIRSHDDQTSQQSASNYKVFLEESLINPVSKNLQDELDYYVYSNNVKHFETQIVQKFPPQTRMQPVSLYPSRKNFHIVKDSTTKFLMEQMKIINFFCNDENTPPQIYFSCLIGRHRGIRNFFGLQRRDNDLLGYFQYLPSCSWRNLKELSKKANFKKSSIPILLFQVLNLIIRFRESNILHGNLVPQSFICDEETLSLKVSDLSLCLEFSSSNDRKSRYYSSQLARNLFLGQDVLALCLLTFQLYTGTEPQVEEVLKSVQNNIYCKSWHFIPFQGFEFMKSLVLIHNKNHQPCDNQLRSLLSHCLFKEEKGHNFLK